MQCPVTTTAAPALNTDVEAALAKIREGKDLSFQEAARALDHLKSLPPEDRTRLLHG